jgi:hypothetical protein
MRDQNKALYEVLAFLYLSTAEGSDYHDRAPSSFSTNQCAETNR